MKENHDDRDYDSDLVTLDLNFIFLRAFVVQRPTHTDELGLKSYCQRLINTLKLFSNNIVFQRYV